MVPLLIASKRYGKKGIPSPKDGEVGPRGDERLLGVSESHLPGSLVHRNNLEDERVRRGT